MVSNSNLTGPQGQEGLGPRCRLECVAAGSETGGDSSPHTYTLPPFSFPFLPLFFSPSHLNVVDWSHYQRPRRVGAEDDLLTGAGV